MIQDNLDKKMSKLHEQPTTNQQGRLGQTPIMTCMGGAFFSQKNASQPFQSRRIARITIGLTRQGAADSFFSEVTSESEFDFNTTHQRT